MTGNSSGNSVTSAIVNVAVNPSLACDLESSYSTWTNGQNEGYGFQPWFLAGSGEYYGFILAPSGSIDTSGNSWVLYANGTGTPCAYAFRGFSSPLTVGEIFSVQFANSSGVTSGSMGFCLQSSNQTVLAGSANAPPPIVTNSATRFAFYYAGSQNDYTIWDGKGASDSGIPYTTAGVTLQFSLASANAYKLTILAGTTSTVLTNWSGPLAGVSGAPVQMFTAFNVDTGAYQNAYYNTLEISAAAPIVTISGHTATITWSSTPLNYYRVLATTNLARPFTPVSGVIQATGLSTTYIDTSNSPPASQKFYKIEIVP